MDESRIDQIQNGDGVPVFLGTETTSIEGMVDPSAVPASSSRKRHSLPSRILCLKIMRMMDALRKAGIDTVALITERPGGTVTRGGQ